MATASLHPLLDPRGLQKRPLLQLAPRVSMEDLRKGPVLFYDNTKLAVARILGDGKRKRTRAFGELVSH